MPLEGYLVKLVELIVTPFGNLDRVWLGILPLYVSMILGEFYITRVSFGHAVGNGFLMLWAGLSWAVHLANAGKFAYVFNTSTKITAWIVTGTCLAVAVFTIVLGLRKKDKQLAAVLGHTRFSAYFLITLYPMQSGLLPWTWTSLTAVLIFAAPAWFLIFLVGWVCRTAAK